MLGAEEAGDPKRPHLPAAERPQEQRPTGEIEPDDDERHDAAAGADMVLPGGQQIEALIGGGPRIVAFERAPERLGGRHVVEDLDPRDPARAGRHRDATFSWPA